MELAFQAIKDATENMTALMDPTKPTALAVDKENSNVRPASALPNHENAIEKLTVEMEAMKLNAVS